MTTQGNHDSAFFLDGRTRSMLKSTNMDYFISNISELRRTNGMVSRGLGSTVGRSAAGSNAGKESRAGSIQNQEEVKTDGKNTPEIKIVTNEKDNAD